MGKPQRPLGSVKMDVKCEYCGTALRRYPMKSGRYYCNTEHKAAWQRLQKPVTREWLYQKYVVEGLTANDIAKIVNRHSKRVWEWLRNEGIETRPRGQYQLEHGLSFEKGKPSAFKGHRHTEEFKEQQRQRRLKDGHVPYLDLELVSETEA